MINKIKHLIIFLTGLLVLDVITTLYLLSNITGAIELNPLLNLGNNVMLNVVLSHIFAIGVIWWLLRRLKRKDQTKQHKYAYRWVFALNVFYGIIVSCNISQIIIWSIL